MISGIGKKILAFLHKFFCSTGQRAPREASVLFLLPRNEKNKATDRHAQYTLLYICFCKSEMSNVCKSLTMMGRSIRRFFRDARDICSTVWHFRRVLWKGRAFFADENNADVLAKLFERRGAFYIKMGQWLAQRPDAFPRAFCKRLKKLQTQAPEHSWEDTLNAFGSAVTNQVINEAFEWNDVDAATGKPIAMNSGSIAQVYFCKTTPAKLARFRAAVNVGKAEGAVYDRCETYFQCDKNDNTDADAVVNCVLKVCHPDVHARFERALRTVVQIYSGLKRAFGGSDSALNMFDICDITREMHHQCNLLEEVCNGDTLRANFARNNYIHIPEIYLATSTWLVEECVENAMYYDDIANNTVSGRGKDTFHYYNDEAARISTQLLAKEITMAAFLQQLLYDGFAHGDLHSGNILYRLEPKPEADYRRELADMEAHAVDGKPVHVSPMNITVSFIDFGIAVDIDDRLKDAMLDLTVSINAGDPLLLAQAFGKVMDGRKMLSQDRIDRFEDDCVRTIRELRERDQHVAPITFQDQVMVILENFRVHQLCINAVALRVIIGWLLIDEDAPVKGRDDNLPDNTLRWVAMEDHDDRFHMHKLAGIIFAARETCRHAERVEAKNAAHGRNVSTAHIRSAIAPNIETMRRREREGRQLALDMIEMLDGASDDESGDTRGSEDGCNGFDSDGSCAANCSTDPAAPLLKRNSKAGAGRKKSKQKRGKVRRNI